MKSIELSPKQVGILLALLDDHQQTITDEGEPADSYKATTIQCLYDKLDHMYLAPLERLAMNGAKVEFVWTYSKTEGDY